MSALDVTEGFHLLPHQASTLAPKIDALFLAVAGLDLLVFLVVLALMLRFVIHYRHGNTRADRTHRITTHAEIWLEVWWTAIPALIFLGLFAWAGWLYVRIYTMPRDALAIQAIGKQWMWQFQHPGGQREINELHVPVGQPVRIALASQDVIHSLFIPAFRLKRDVVPGLFNELWFEATRPGEYALFCAEYCGSSHSGMRGRVVALSPKDYGDWLSRQPVRDSLAAQGAALFRAYGCSGCHADNSPVHAPDLAGLYGHPVQLEGGRRRIADDAYIRDSILLPKKDVAVGFTPIMPSFAGQIDDADILKIIAYLKSLNPEQEIRE